uniref:JmjC domain-containing protein 7 n=1 Tax=Anthurium amnicola TaxID=1678845 RepID=A0A1D1Z657_9ARAE
MEEGERRLAAAVAELWWEVRELSLGTSPGVDVLDGPPSPLAFLRDYVSGNKPCLVRGGAAHWPAVAHSLWSRDSYLLRALGPTRPVSLHLTPDGRADALAPLPSDPGRRRCCFASPCVRRVPFAAALPLVAASSSSSSRVVAYAQEQNDCFRSADEYGGSSLAGDVGDDVPWATAALGCAPEAVNLWVGSGRSETSFHKDHYENLYAVVTGEKHFLLLPPTDVHRLYVRPFPAAHYVPAATGAEADADEELLEQGLRLELEEPRREVPWCSVDPYPRTPQEASRAREQFPLYFQGPQPFRCTVRAGDILYLPTMWFHHVRQTPDSSGRTIALNFWYDMRFDIKYAYFNLLQSLDYPSGHHAQVQAGDDPPPHPGSTADGVVAADDAENRG